jgi:hypothetical protein
LIFLICLFPLACYSLYLAFINRGRHPVLMRGTWDFAGVLLAASGFLLLGGPTILNGLYESRRLAWVLGARPFIPGLAGNDWLLWASFWVVYYAGVLGGGAFLLLRRRWTLSIYNIEPDLFDAAFAQALQPLGLEAVRLGNRIVIEAPNGFSGLPRQTASAAAAEPPREPNGSLAALAATVGATTVAVLEVDPFPAMRHVSLTWLDEPGPLFKEVEGELSRALEQVPAANSQVAGWFLTVALSFLCVTVLGALFWILLVMIRIIRL